jgi:hypothetical protein
MSVRKPGGNAGSKNPKLEDKPAVSPDLVIPPIVPSADHAKRVAAKEAASRLAKMTPEEQAAALFQSMGGLRKR